MFWPKRPDKLKIQVKQVSRSRRHVAVPCHMVRQISTIGATGPAAPRRRCRLLSAISGMVSVGPSPGKVFTSFGEKDQRMEATKRTSTDRGGVVCLLQHR
jgi:hypothetical protein